MSNPEERQAGTSGSTMGYERGQARGQDEAERGAGRGYAPAGHRAEPRVAAVVGTALAGTPLVLRGAWGASVGLLALSARQGLIKGPFDRDAHYLAYHR